MFARKIKLFLPVLAVSIGAFVFIGQGKAFAGTVTSTFPRDNNWVLLSKYNCSGHCLHTPNASFRIFYDTNSDEYQDNNTFSVSVDVICRGGTSRPGSGMQLGTNGIKGWQSCGGKLSTSPDYTISQTLGKGALKTDGGGHGYPARYAYTDLSTKLGDGDPDDTIIAIIVRANNGGKVTFQEIPAGRNGNPLGGNSNNYTGHGSGTRNGPYPLLSSDGSGTAFALFQNTGGATYPRNFSAYFKTDCNLDTNQAVYLRWYDSDDGTSTQPFNLSFDLFDETDNKYVYNNYNGNLGGNDSYRQIKFVAEVGHQYRWTWNNVASINGVQLWMPFSEFNRDINCASHSPPQGNVTANCQAVIATGIKGENDSGSITKKLPVQIRLWNAGTGTYVRTTYSGTSNASGKFSHATPDWVQNRDANNDVTVQLFVKDYSQSGDPYIKTGTATINEPCDGPGSPITCPSIPSNPTDINLTGDNGKVPGPYNSDMDSYPLKPQNTVVWANNRNTANFEYVIQKITDQYGQDISIPSKHWTPQDKSDNPFHVNWAPFINQYQYDAHALTVIYTTYYQTYKYKATQKVLNPDGTTKGWKMVYTGESGQDHTSPNDTESHPGNGNWAKDACYNRNFKVHDITGDASLNGDNENPNGATFNFSIPVNFSLPHGDTPLHNPNKVCGLTYSATYYIKKANGSYGGGMPGHGSDSGPISSGPNCVGGNWADDITVNLNKSYSATLVPPMQAGDRICMNFSVSKAEGTMDENGTIKSVSQNSIGSPDYCSNPVVDKPYVRAYGADVLSGSNFRTGSTCIPNADDNNRMIKAYRSTDSGKSGSGVQFAAIGMSQISGFGSASTRTVGSPSWATGLSFANTGDVTGGVVGGDANQHNDGGKYGGDAFCTMDYFATKKDIAKAINSSSTNPGDLTSRVNSNGGDPTQFFVSSAHTPFTISNSSHVDFAKQATIYVDGDVNITDDLTFSPGSYLAIIARGNINISGGVRRLDGLYVAQPKADGSAGVIYTCYDTSAGHAYTIDDLYGSCHNQLVVNGAFAAKEVKFVRTANSLRDSTTRESAASSHAAEIFNFTPEIYLYSPVFEDVSNSQPYQYITTLSPVL